MYNIERKNNEDLRFNIRLERPSGTPRDITGYTASMQIRTKSDDTSALVDASGHISIVATSGLISIAIPVSGHMDTLTNGVYVYDVRITNAASTVTDTILDGNLIIREGVTR